MVSRKLLFARIYEKDVGEKIAAEQRPIREPDNFRSNKIEYKKVNANGNLVLNSIKGRLVDMEITIQPKDHLICGQIRPER